MGIVTQAATGGTVINVRFSAFLGMMYVSNPETEASIAAVKAAIGEEAVKAGYVGTGLDTPSGRARAELKKFGIEPVSLAGELRTVRLQTRKNAAGIERQYLTVGVRDADGRYFASLDIAAKATHMLVRKLSKCEPGLETSVSMFTTYGAKPGKDRAYADPGVSVKQKGAEVKGESVDELVKRRDAALAALKAIPGIAKEALRQQGQAVELAYHLELVKGIEAKFASFYDQSQEEAPASASAV
jgi:hypothetical protein